MSHAASAAPTDEFDACYLATSARLTRQMVAMTGDRSDAQEIVQEAHARAWQHWRTVRDAADPEAWLRTVAWRLAAGRWRRARHAVVAWGRHGAAAPVDEPSPDHVTLVAALRGLPEPQRRAVVLHHLAGLLVEAVAHETGAPVGTVKARLRRGRATLAVALADLAPVPAAPAGTSSSAPAPAAPRREHPRG